MTRRTVLVTGGAKGIGRACTERFAMAGHRVIVTGRDESALDRVAHDLPGVEALPFDVTDAEAWERLDLEVDVLVANAGLEHAAPLQRTTLDQWQRVLAVNATGVFLAARALLPFMRGQDWGRLVAVASVASHRGVAYGSAYSAAKHAVLGLVRSIALELAGTGVTANCVCPGFVATDMTERSIERIVEATGRDEDQARAAVAGMQPLGRFVEPVEVAAAVAYLASEEAAAVNGTSIVLDGGGVQA